MKIKFCKIHQSAITPTKAYASDAGYDLYANKSYTIQPGQTIKVGTGIALDIPKGYYAEIVPRSGWSYKTKLRIANSPGIIDSGYHGEVIILMHNISDDPFEIYEINQGDRIAQMIFQKVNDFELEESSDFSVSCREARGFGSSGR